MATLESFSDEYVDADTFKILLATDIHLGYKENDPIRGNDSFETFEEVLKIAKNANVDFVLLGGDLFHVNKPSINSYLKCVDVLRKYCLGDKQCKLEYCSSPDKRFSGECEAPVNFLDPNMNISIPVFTIHGNHDDPLPLSDRNLSALCILAASGLVNYFGKTDGGDNIDVSPIYLKKGSSGIGLFGMGAIWNDIVYRAFINGKVKFSEHTDEFMNIFVLHQNRVKRAEKSFVKPEFIPDFFDLVFWGHEHDCRIEPEEIHIGSNSSYYVTQPGSTVATSLAQGESGDKFVGILYVKGKKFNITPIKLKTVRPFIMGELSLQEKLIDVKDEKMQIYYIKNKVSDLVEEIKETNPNSKKLPLIRLKVDISGGYKSIPSRHFLDEFCGILANPTDVLLFKSSSSGVRRRVHLHEDSEEELDTLGVNNAIEEDTVIEIYKRHLDDKSRICPPKHMAAAIESFVLKDQPTAISDFINYIQGHSSAIIDSMINDETLDRLDSFDVINLIKRELEDNINIVDPLEIPDIKYHVEPTSYLASSSQQNTTYLSSMVSQGSMTYLDESDEDIVEIISESPAKSSTQRTMGNTALCGHSKAGVKKNLQVKGKPGRGRAHTVKRTHSNSIDSFSSGSMSGIPKGGKRPRL